jgi:GNAT superfamily N-acetyltransferase
MALNTIRISFPMKTMTHKRTRQPPQRYSELTEYGVLHAEPQTIDHAMCYVFFLEPYFAIITDFLVDEPQRKKGIGKKLVEHLKSKFPTRTFFLSSEEDAEPFWSKVATQLPYQAMPTIVKCHIDRWGHRKFKQFTFSQQPSAPHQTQTSPT